MINLDSLDTQGFECQDEANSWQDAFTPQNQEDDEDFPMPFWLLKSLNAAQAPTNELGQPNSIETCLSADESVDDDGTHQEHSSATGKVVCSESKYHSVDNDFDPEKAARQAVGLSEASVSDKLRRLLSPWFRGLVHPFKDDRELLTALLTAIVISGGVLPRVTCRYDKGRVYPTLYLFMVMPPAAGKGVAGLCRLLLTDIDSDLAKDYVLAEQRYQASQRKEKASRADEMDLIARSLLSPEVTPVEKPKRRMLVVSGDFTNAKLVEQMHDNGIYPTVVMETEADLVAIALQSEHGKGSSPNFRKAFHHEAISMIRKSQPEPLSILTPKLTLILTGTENQLPGLFKSNEDGLFSRFMFDIGDYPVEWRNVQPREGEVLVEDHYYAWAKKYQAVWSVLQDYQAEIQLTQAQWDQLNKIGEGFQSRSHLEGGEYAVSIARRHALMTVRVAMILSVFRHIDPNKVDYASVKTALKPVMVCHDDDYTVAKALVDKSFRNALGLYKRMQPEKGAVENKRMKGYYEALPSQFATRDAKQIAAHMGISERSFPRYLKKFCELKLMSHVSTGIYHKQ